MKLPQNLTMSNRDKRLEKGIKSTEEQIRKHKEKLREALADGNEDLGGYYEKEIKGMEEQIKRKKNILNK
jgi:phage shock protein A